MRKKMKALENKMLCMAGTGYCTATAALAEVDGERKQEISAKVSKVFNVAVIFMTLACAVGMLVPAFATGSSTTTTNNDPAATVLGKMIELIEKVFKYVGVILAVYSIGQLIMAFKNEDADSKSRATTMLVVACCLIGIATFVNTTNITSYLNK